MDEVQEQQSESQHMPTRDEVLAAMSVNGYKAAEEAFDSSLRVCVPAAAPAAKPAVEKPKGQGGLIGAVLGGGTALAAALHVRSDPLLATQFGCPDGRFNVYLEHDSNEPAHRKGIMLPEPYLGSDPYARVVRTQMGITLTTSESSKQQVLKIR